METVLTKQADATSTEQVVLVQGVNVNDLVSTIIGKCVKDDVVKSTSRSLPNGVEIHGRIEGVSIEYALTKGYPVKVAVGSELASLAGVAAALIMAGCVKDNILAKLEAALTQAHNEGKSLGEVLGDDDRRMADALKNDIDAMLERLKGNGVANDRPGSVKVIASVKTTKHEITAQGIQPPKAKKK